MKNKLSPILFLLFILFSSVYSVPKSRLCNVEIRGTYYKNGKKIYNQHSKCWSVYPIPLAITDGKTYKTDSVVYTIEYR